MPTENITPGDVCSYPNCGRRHSARGLCAGHYKQAHAGADLRSLRADRDEAAEFRARVDKNGPTQPHMGTCCWPWTGGRDGDGYGRAWFRGRKQGAHRVAWMLANDADIPAGHVVMHECDYPPCCRPDHLHVPATAGCAENNADRDVKGRQVPSYGDRNGARTRPGSVARGDAHGSRIHPDSVLRGSANGNARLNEADVLAIRERVAAGMSQRAVARDFGVSQRTVGLIVHREHWQHVP